MAHEGPRERELHRYYQPWLETFHASNHPTILRDTSPRADGHIPQSSTDKSLTSFAQLGALRLGGTRGIVTLIDRSHQYVLAEATKTLSLMDDDIHGPGDELWLGNSVLPRGQGMSEHALRPEDYTARDPDGTTYKAPAMVVPDVTIDPVFRTRAFAGSGITFYAGVPLVTRLGHHIGVYTVTDANPRSNLTAQELRFLVDMSSIVIRHLEVVKNVRARARGERLIKGIGAFLEGCRNPDGTIDSDDGLYKEKRPNKTLDAENDPTKAQERPKLAQLQPLSDQFKGMSISDANTVGRENYTSYDAADPPPPSNVDSSTKESLAEATSSKDVTIQTGKAVKDQPALPPLPPAQDPKYQTQGLYERASRILRRSLGADGVVFLDASSANLSQGTHKRGNISSKTRRGTRNRDKTNGATNSISSIAVDALSDERETEGSFSSDNHPSSGEQPRVLKHNQPCQIISMSRLDKQPQRPFRLSQRSLLKLLRRYSQGKVYSFDADGSLASSDEGSESTVSTEFGEGGASTDRSKGHSDVRVRKHPLLNNFPVARTVVFLPLWDFSKDRWNSAAIIWSNNIGKLMNIRDDIAYLAAFGNSVMNELARLNLIVSDFAKVTFLANISHELRSPLHGILGSIEFLHESPLDDFQSNMVINVETCGKTLLDTINHVLDFAKLNNLSKDAQRGITQATTSDNSLTSVFDLAVVVEESVEAVYAGQVFRTANADALEGRGPPLSSYNRAMHKRQDIKAKIALGQAALSSNVCLTLNVEDAANWHVSSQPGAISRILMNLLGNSLKYTRSGAITVSLEVDRSRQEANDPCLHTILIVSDTGKGMSEDFVKNHAFTAFRQENSLASGTGLGLSIIRQIVDSLGGKIDMQSQKGVGTEVRIWLSLQISQMAPQQTTLHQVRKKTSGLMMCLLDPRNDYTPNHEHDLPIFQKGLGRTRTVDDSLRSLTSEWFSMQVFTAPSMDGITADFFVYAEPPPIEYLLHQHGQNGLAAETPVLIFCQNTFQANSLRANGIHHLTEIGRIIEVVAQPVGPQKLAKVLQRCLQRSKKLEKLDRNSENNSPKGVTPFVHKDEEIEAIEETPQPTRRPSKESAHPNNEVTFLRPGPTHRQTAPSPSVGQTPTRPGHQSTPSDEGPRGARVLVVDDNDINLQLLIAFVRKAKLSFESASDGLQAVEAYKRCLFSEQLQFKYVVMDISMPVMDGLTACREIRKLEKQENIQTPAVVIALTGMGEEGDIKDEAKEAGFTKFLTKPVRFQVLREMLV